MLSKILTNEDSRDHYLHLTAKVAIVTDPKAIAE
jgi:hypothetical protein